MPYLSSQTPLPPDPLALVDVLDEVEELVSLDVELLEVSDDSDVLEDSELVELVSLPAVGVELLGATAEGALSLQADRPAAIAIASAAPAVRNRSDVMDISSPHRPGGRV